MNRSADPHWIALASRIYGSCLKLYPSALQKEHGEEMKLAFRDRCREAIARGNGPLGLLFREWMPDFLRSVAESHFSGPAFSSSPRQILALGLLSLSLLGLVMKDQLSGLVLDTGFALRNQWRDYRYRAELEHLETQALTQAESLAASGDAQDQAVAAYLYSSLAPDRVATVDLINQGFARPGWVGFAAGASGAAKYATQLVAQVVRTTSSAPALAIAAEACDPSSAGCDRAAVVKKLLAVDGDNAFAWGMAYSEAARTGDTGAQASALNGMAASSHYENYRGRMRARLFAAAAALDGSEGHLAAIAWAERRAIYGTISDWYNDARFACTTNPENASSRPHWIDLHPESAADCARIVSLLSRSGEFRESSWALQRQLTKAVGDEALGTVWAQWRELAWLESHHGGMLHPNQDREGYSYERWSEQQWAQWARVSALGDGEIPAMRRWLAANGEPIQAPAWFFSKRPEAKSYR